MEQLYVFGTGNATVTRYYNTCFAIKNPENQYFMVDTGGGNGINSAYYSAALLPGFAT